MRIQSEKYVDKYIINALFDLMKRKNYDSISITEITNKAGVGRNSFYRNFNSKEDIIKKWIQDTTNDFLETSKISLKSDSVETYFIKLFSHLEKYKEEAILISKANLTHLLKNEFENKLLTIHKNEFNNYKSYFLAGGIFNVYYYWLISGSKESPEELSKKLVNLIQK